MQSSENTAISAPRDLASAASSRMRLELPSKSPTVGLNWARAIFMSGGQGALDTSCFSALENCSSGALKCAATKSTTAARFDETELAATKAKSKAKANATPENRLRAAGQKKLPKDKSLGSDAHPHRS